jgi:hypothetical protein
MHYFDFVETIHGVTIVPVSERLTTASRHATEIDDQVQAIKADLDRVAKMMKSAISVQKPLGLRTTCDT